MIRPKITDGGMAWAALAASVVSYDIWAVRTGHETLSTAFGRAVLCPRKRWPTIVVWFFLTAHLFGPMAPPWLQWLRHFDPIGALVHLIAGA